MSEEVYAHNHGGRPRKWASNAERMATKRQEARDTDEQVRRDEEYIQEELEITRARYADDPNLNERMQRSEAYLRKWVAGEIGSRSK